MSTRLPAEAPRILIDCTNLVRQGGNSGIFRSEAGLIRGLKEMCKNAGVQCLTVFYVPAAGFVEVSNVENGERNIGYLHKIRLSLVEYWRVKNLFAHVFPFAFSRRVISFVWDNHLKWLAIFPLFLLSSPVLLLAFFVCFIPACERVVPAERDIFLVIGSGWYSRWFSGALSRLLRSRARIVTLIHDFIPLNYPQLSNYRLTLYFERHIERILRSSTLLLANSVSTAEDIQRHLDKYNVGKKDIAAVRLGANLEKVREEEQRIVRSELLTLYKGDDSVIISVGKIEPKKNHAFLLDAMDEVWRRKARCKLCIIGKKGWKSEALIERILTHPLYHTSLFWFTDLDDSELEYCYRHASALVFPSIVEGFGLPLVEALSYGCRVLASDIPIFREVGGAHCSYFSLEKSGDLSELIIRVTEGRLDSGAAHAQCEFVWPTWRESAGELLSILDEKFDLR